MSWPQPTFSFVAIVLVIALYRLARDIGQSFEKKQADASPTASELAIPCSWNGLGCQTLWYYARRQLSVLTRSQAVHIGYPEPHVSPTSSAHTGF